MDRFCSWSRICVLLVFSFLGLGACKLFALPEPIGWAFSAIWILSLVILVPLRILVLDKKHVAEVQGKVEKQEIDLTEMYAAGRIVFAANFAKLPKWIYMPFLIILWLLIGILALCLLGALGLY